MLKNYIGAEAAADALTQQLEVSRGERRPRRAALGDRGVAALEFAFVALPFFALMLAMFEVGIMFFEQGLLNYQVGDLGRQIRTGQLFNQFGGGQLSTADTSRLVGNLCSKMYLPNCTSQLYLDIQDFGSLGDVKNGTTPTKKFPPSLVNLGQACHVQLIQVYYPWKLLVPLNYPFLSSTDFNGSHILASSTLVETEPFQATPCTPSLKAAS